MIGVYLKTIEGPNAKVDMEIQLSMIEGELKSRGIPKEEIVFFSDFVNKKRFSYKGFRELISAVAEGMVTEIYVDLALRLTGSKELTQRFNKLVLEKDVTVVEAARLNRESLDRPVAAIYHCLSVRKGSEVYRTRGTLEDIAAMYNKAIINGYTVGRVYIDTSFNEARTDRELLLNEDFNKYEAIVTKSFYHMTRRVGSLAKFAFVKRIISCEEGELTLETGTDNNCNTIIVASKNDSLLAERMNLFISRHEEYKVIDVVDSKTDLKNLLVANVGAVMFPTWNQVYVNAVSDLFKAGVAVASMEGILSIKKGGG